MTEIAIRVRNVSKRYHVYDSERSRLAHALWPRRANGAREIAALDDVSFDVRRGESFGVIGRNGGGKSTLLQILTGVLRPTSGEVEVNGRVSALLELGSGFNPDYTGRDNVMLNGILLGLTREEVASRFGEIVAFAEIGEAIERPVKTYSNGMVLRLAYAVQALVDPEILVIDEALSVGDFFFQQKCFGHLRALRERGVTVVFVSHDMATVRDLCKECIHLRGGRLAFKGDASSTIRSYLAERDDSNVSSPAQAAVTNVAGDGELQAIIHDSIWQREQSPDGAGRLIAVAVYEESGRPSMVFRIGETMRIMVAYRPVSGRPIHVAVAIRNKYDQVVTTTGSAQLDLAPPASDGVAAAIFDMEMALQLEAGNYSLVVTLGHVVAPNRGEYVDATQAIGPISIHWNYEQDVAPFLGMFGPRAKATFRQVAAGKGG